MPKNDNLVTKDYLDKRLSRFKNELKDELKGELIEFKDELKGELVELKDELKNGLVEMKDEIVGEIKAMREDFDAHQVQHQRINDTFEEHETRLQKLENPG